MKHNEHLPETVTSVIIEEHGWSGWLVVTALGTDSIIVLPPGKLGICILVLYLQDIDSISIKLRGTKNQP